MFGAPRIYETIRSQIWLKIDESYWLNRLLYRYFIQVGEKSASYRMSGKAMPPTLRFKAWLGYQMMFRPLINQIGLLRLRRAYTGGAALGPELFTFYQAIGGGEIKESTASDEWVRLQIGTGADIGFQRDLSYEPPDWPDGPPQQAHLDFDVTDLEEAEQAVIALGAIKTASQPSPSAWRVFLDPAGHPFCLVKV
jgi:hypothetical protein